MGDRRVGGERTRLVMAALAGGLLVAVLVTLRAGAHAGLCAPEPRGACDGFIRMLSMRMGAVAGIATVLVLLMMVGLHRMVVQEEERRRDPDRAEQASPSLPS